MFTYFLFFYYKARQRANGGHHVSRPQTNRLKNNFEKPKEKRRLGTASNKVTGVGLQLVCGRPTLALSSAWAPHTLSYSICAEKKYRITVKINVCRYFNRIKGTATVSEGENNCCTDCMVISSPECRMH